MPYVPVARLAFFLETAVSYLFAPLRQSMSWPRTSSEELVASTCLKISFVYSSALASASSSTKYVHAHHVEAFEK